MEENRVLTEEEENEIAHALQYGTAEEAVAAVRKLRGQGKEIRAGSPIEKVVENLETRERIHEAREDEVARSIAGEDEFGDFEPEPKTVDGVVIKYGLSHTQEVLRPVVKAFPDVMNTLTKREAMSERVNYLAEEEGYDLDDSGTYMEAAAWVQEWSTKLDRIEDEEERAQAMKDYMTARGKQFREEEEGDI
jgi:hypothetical protein